MAEQREKVMLEIGFQVDEDAVARVKKALQEGGDGRASARRGGSGSGQRAQHTSQGKQAGASGGDLAAAGAAGGAMGAAMALVAQKLEALVSRLDPLTSIKEDFTGAMDQTLTEIKDAISALGGTRQMRQEVETRASAMMQTTSDLGIAAAYMSDDEIREINNFNRDLARLQNVGRERVRQVAMGDGNDVVEQLQQIFGQPSPGRIPTRFR